jgi:hypothetical protein
MPVNDLDDDILEELNATTNDGDVYTVPEPRKVNKTHG